MIKVSKEKLTKDDKVLLKRYIIDLCQKQRFENNLERDYDIDTIEKDLYDMNVIDSLTTKCYNKVFCELLHKNLI